jgi:ABC-type glutathione transport system ATPase component
VIRADNVWMKFGRHEALRGLNMSVSEGSAYALIGGNGAGKTTRKRPCRICRRVVPAGSASRSPTTGLSGAGLPDRPPAEDASELAQPEPGLHHRLEA